MAALAAGWWYVLLVLVVCTGVVCWHPPEA
jgi:hypothetical protein